MEGEGWNSLVELATGDCFGDEPRVWATRRMVAMHKGRVDVATRAQRRRHLHDTHCTTYESTACMHVGEVRACQVGECMQSGCACNEAMRAKCEPLPVTPRDV